jgi:hypothetical protein
MWPFRDLIFQTKIQTGVKIHFLPDSLSKQDAELTFKNAESI